MFNYLWFSALYGVFVKELKRIIKIPGQAIGTPLISSILYLLIFGISFSTSFSISAKPSYLGFLLPGLVMLSSLRNSFENAASVLVISKYHNELQDYRILPLSPLQMILGYSLSSIVRGSLIGILTWLFGETLHYILFKEFVGIAHPFYLLFFIVTGGFVFSLLGICVGMKARSFDQVGSITSFILTPLLYLGGVFMPLDLLHPLWKKISLLNPLFYFIDALRYAALSYHQVSIAAALWIMSLSALFFFFLAKRCLQNGRNFYR